jgi:hypothetical protein
MNTECSTTNNHSSIINNPIKMANIRPNNQLSIINNHCESSTLVESALQINPFLTNKAKFRKSQINVTYVITRNYEIKDTWWSGKKQSQTKPNKPKSKKAKMNVNKVLTKDYEKISNWAICENKPNSNPNKPNFKPKKICLGGTKIFDNY